MSLRRALRHLLRRPGQRELLIRILDRIDLLEERMSALDEATTDLTAAVLEVADLITAPTDVLQAKLDEALAKLAEAQSNDVADAETIARLQGEAVELLTDASENVSVITAQTAKLRALGETPPPENPEQPAPPVVEG